jgi:hypothetical protein
MGISSFDTDSIGHVLGGMLAYSLLEYNDVPILYNFGIANSVHYMIERMEKSVAPNGRVLETYENHVGDIISFFVGWMFAYYCRMDRYITPGNSFILWIVLIGYMSKEMLREIYPYNINLNGSYTQDK